MKFFAALILILVSLGWIAFGSYYYVCDIRGLCSEEVIEETQPRVKTLNLRDGNVIILEDFEQFLFKKGQVKPEMNENNEGFLDQLASFLERNGTKNLTITGHYLLSERDSTILGSFQENLGLARAEALRELLVNRGIDENRIFLEHKMINGDQLPEEPASFSLSSSETSIPEEYQRLVFTFENMTFTEASFPYNSSEFIPGTQFKAYADSVRNYMTDNDDKSLYIIGHADSVGGYEFNYKLGMQRAASAGQYFENLGIKNKIRVDSKGDMEPVADNNSDEGRQKNRRVNVKIE